MLRAEHSPYVGDLMEVKCTGCPSGNRHTYYQEALETCTHHSVHGSIVYSERCVKYVYHELLSKDHGEV